MRAGSDETSREEREASLDILLSATSELDHQYLDPGHPRLLVSNDGISTPTTPAVMHRTACECHSQRRTEPCLSCGFKAPISVNRECVSTQPSLSERLVHLGTLCRAGPLEFQFTL